MLIDKNILLACGVSFALHGVIFGMSGFGRTTVEQKPIPEEMRINIKIQNPALLPKINTLGETMKIKKTEASHESVLQKAMEVPKKDFRPESPETKIKPKLPDSAQKPETENRSEEAINPLNPDKEAMLDFHNIVKQRIEEARRYPLWAKKKGIQGIARIAFTVLPDGTCRNINLAGSSGSEILDQEALETLKRATPFPSVPEKISKSAVSLEVGIVFSLQQKE